MLFTMTCFGFMILTIYAAAIFFMEGSKTSDLLASVTTFLTTGFLFLHVFGIAALGQMIKTEVRQHYQTIH